MLTESQKQRKQELEWTGNLSEADRVELEGLVALDVPEEIKPKLNFGERMKLWRKNLKKN